MSPKRNVISNKVAKAIREARAAGVTYRQIMIKFDVSQATIYRYTDDEKLERTKAANTRRWQRLKADPTAYARYLEVKRVSQRNYARRMSEENKRIREEIRKLKSGV